MLINAGELSYCPSCNHIWRWDTNTDHCLNCGDADIVPPLDYITELHSTLAEEAGLLRGLLADLGLRPVVESGVEPIGALRQEFSRTRAELSDVRGRLEEAWGLLDEYLHLHPDIAQLFDGWHADIAWTEWDQEVRMKQAAFGMKVDAFLASAPVSEGQAREPSFRIDVDEDGLDDLAVSGVSMVRIERMDDRNYWLHLHLVDGREVDMALWSRGKVKSRVDVITAEGAIGTVEASHPPHPMDAMGDSMGGAMDTPIERTGWHDVQDVEEEVNRIRYGKRREASSEAVACQWTEDGGGVWHTSCGNLFEWNHGSTAEENGANFCLYCGKKLVPVPVSDESAQEKGK